MAASKKVLITQSNYIPWKGYFDAIHLVDEFIIYDDVQYTRRDWRNRNKIKTPTGPQWLTIPVDTKGKYFQQVNETKINESRWFEKHWKTIEFNYSKAESFKEFFPLLKEAYHQTSGLLYLSEINLHLIQTICSFLGIKTTISSSSNFDLVEGQTERLVDLCKKVKATEYYTGPAAKAYIKEDLFTEEKIALKYLDYYGYKEYKQLHGNFTHEVSVVDLLLNEGNKAGSFMKYL